MTATGNQQPVPIAAPVIFLDTNAVHHATLALSFGSENSFDVLARSSEDMKATLQARGTTASDRYVDGARIVRYLSQRFQEAAAVFYFSPLTGLELLCGALRGEAIKRAAQVGVPNRWFFRMDEKEIRICLEPNGYTQAQVHQSNVEELFDGVGLTLTEQLVNQEVFALARALMENVFVNVQDCLVYASAVIAQASELITGDRYFRETICWTNNPGAAPRELGARFTSLRTAVRSTCAEILGWDVENADKVVVPLQVGIADIKRLLNEDRA